MEDILEIAIAVARVVERLAARHLVAGSLASSVHGIPRSTQDVDFVADLSLEDVEAVVGALQG